MNVDNRITGVGETDSTGEATGLLFEPNESKKQVQPSMISMAIGR